MVPDAEDPDDKPSLFPGAKWIWTKGYKSGKSVYHPTVWCRHRFEGRGSLACSALKQLLNSCANKHRIQLGSIG